MKYIIIKLIKIYQHIPGPWHSSCRHYPTCSNYFIESVQEYGALKGSIMGIKRILKCNPVSRGGIDLVPNNKIKRKVNK